MSERESTVEPSVSNHSSCQNSLTNSLLPTLLRLEIVDRWLYSTDGLTCGLYLQECIIYL